MRQNPLIMNKGENPAKHLIHQVSETPKKAEKEAFKSIRASAEAKELIDDLYHDKRFSNRADALDYIIGIYKDAIEGKLPTE